MNSNIQGDKTIELNSWQGASTLWSLRKLAECLRLGLMPGFSLALPGKAALVQAPSQCAAVWTVWVVCQRSAHAAGRRSCAMRSWSGERLVRGAAAGPRHLFKGGSGISILAIGLISVVS